MIRMEEWQHIGGTRVRANLLTFGVDKAAEHKHNSGQHFILGDHEWLRTSTNMEGSWDTKARLSLLGIRASIGAGSAAVPVCRNAHVPLLKLRQPIP